MSPCRSALTVVSPAVAFSVVTPLLAAAQSTAATSSGSVLTAEIRPARRSWVCTLRAFARTSDRR